MPTKEEIRKIARRFSEETSNGDALDPHIDFAAQYAEEVIGWLADRYCLVEKSEVLNEYEDALSEGKHCHPKHQIQSRTRVRELERVFGKEMFEE